MCLLAVGAVSLLYHRPLIGLATGSPALSTRFDLAHFRTRQLALLTFTVSDADTKASTAKCSRQRSGGKLFYVHDTLS